MDEPSLQHGVGDHSGHEPPGPDGVVVAWNRVVHQVGIAVGVDYRDDGHAELAGLGDRDVLLLGVEDEHRSGGFHHVADTAQVALELGQLSFQQQRLLLGHGIELARVAHALVLLHLGDPLGDRVKVGEHPALPPLVDVGHVAALGVGLYGVLGLFLGADEQDHASASDEVPNEDVGALEMGQGLTKVDYVDASLVAVDEAFHLRVPSAGLVAELDPGLQQLLHGDDSHACLLSRFCVARAGRLDDRVKARVAK